LVLTLFYKKCYGYSLSGRESNNQPHNMLPLSCSHWEEAVVQLYSKSMVVNNTKSGTIIFGPECNLRCFTKFITRL